jgi:putative flavoprotein involved in K+ transport
VPAALSSPADDECGGIEAATIIWATGYTYDYHWVKVPVFDERGHPIQRRGLH